MTDTSPETAARYQALLGNLSREERLARALSLSALVRRLAWAGAASAVIDHDPEALLDRYLRQLYGPEDMARLRPLIKQLTPRG